MPTACRLQRAAPDFLMRLVAKHGLLGAARVLRALADHDAPIPAAGPSLAPAFLGRGPLHSDA